MQRNVSSLLTIVLLLLVGAAMNVKAQTSTGTLKGLVTTAPEPLLRGGCDSDPGQHGHETHLHDGFLWTVHVHVYLFYVCWFFSSLGSTTWYGPVFATVQDLTPPRIRSTAVAFLLLVLNLLIGDRVSLWRGLLVCACIGFTAVIPAWLAARRYGTDLARAQQEAT